MYYPTNPFDLFFLNGFINISDSNFIINYKEQ